MTPAKQSIQRSISASNRSIPSLHELSPTSAPLPTPNTRYGGFGFFLRQGHQLSVSVARLHFCRTASSSMSVFFRSDSVSVVAKFYLYQTSLTFRILLPIHQMALPPADVLDSGCQHTYGLEDLLMHISRASSRCLCNQTQVTCFSPVLLFFCVALVSGACCCSESSLLTLRIRLFNPFTAHSVSPCCGFHQWHFPQDLLSLVPAAPFSS